MIITNNREKLINSIIYFARKTKFCGRTKLMKLLYYLDFTHFKETGKSVTGLEYYAWDMGPVPKSLWHELDSGMKQDLKKSVAETKRDVPVDKEESDSYLFKAKKRFDDDFFSNRELRILNEIAEIFKEVTAGQMVESTHMTDTPWAEVWRKGIGKGKPIHYMLAFKCGKLGGLSPEEAQQRKNEIDEINRVFGAV